MNIVITGHVDHGKSTIIGRLLAETGALPQGKLEQIQEFCRQRGQAFEYAFLLDALKDERAQGITIDTARVFFRSPKRNYTILDAPGHSEFLKNMVTGAARAEAALLVIDAAEGIRENSMRHGYLLSMLGVRQVAILINKMDLVDYDEGVFHRLREEYAQFLATLGADTEWFLPVSAVKGDTITTRSSRMPWYDGPTVLEVLDRFRSEAPPLAQPFRMPVQAVYRFSQDNDRRRIVAGTVESGRVSIGDTLVFHPSGKRSRIKTIESFGARELPQTVGAGYATGFTLEEQIYVTRGEIATKEGEPNPRRANKLRVNLFWLGKNPLQKGKRYMLKLGTAKVEAWVERIHRVLDATDLTDTKASADRSTAAEAVERNEVAQCTLALRAPIACDTVDTLAKTARFVIVDDYEIAGGGLVIEAIDEARHLHTSTGHVTYEDRCRLLGQRGLVVWFTGLSASGKSTIAVEVERRLISMGLLAYRLDGDNVRQGLSQDLGFSAADRDENIRRIAEVAALFKDAGVITLVSFISPFRHMRDFARARVGPGAFIEVFVKAGVKTCEARDPNGLYAKARRGEIQEFTGISSPYEEPTNPELVLDTERMSVAECATAVVDVILPVSMKGDEA